MIYKGVVNRIKLLIAYRRKRKIILISYDRNTKVVTAQRSQSGWVANWYSYNDTTVSILLKDGKTAGYSLVHSWLPHSGWDSTDLESFKTEVTGG